VLGEEADGLGSGVEKKVRHLAISPGSREPSFAPISLRPPAIAFLVAFKALVIEPWSAWGANPRPPAQQTGALPTELTRRR